MHWCIQLMHSITINSCSTNHSILLQTMQRRRKTFSITHNDIPFLFNMIVYSKEKSFYVYSVRVQCAYYSLLHIVWCRKRERKKFNGNTKNSIHQWAIPNIGLICLTYIFCCKFPFVWRIFNISVQCTWNKSLWNHNNHRLKIS